MRGLITAAVRCYVLGRTKGMSQTLSENCNIELLRESDDNIITSKS